MLRKQVIAAWRPRCNSSSPRERIESKPCSEGAKGRCQEEKKEKGIVRTNKSKTKPVSSWRCQRQATAAGSLELEIPRVRGALGEYGGAGKSGTAKDERKRPLSNSPSRLLMEEDASLGDL